MFVVNKKAEQVTGKLAYLRRIRRETMYGAYRLVVNVCAGLAILTGLVLLTVSGAGGIVGMVFGCVGLLTIAGGVFFRAAACIPADIADAVMDVVSENEDT